MATPAAQPFASRITSDEEQTFLDKKLWNTAGYLRSHFAPSDQRVPSPRISAR